ncbi:hypothetical protein OU798_07545 [Prolixibacteraceae bacterium Z1-6]|uniref:Uncharacterized protein n=1 Tax=Draconibacterium aestuarii TaxID=2998507 RepID=A0A9X3F7A5_9BACT|nr:hypothetical protein [Prolixibacteraceae bacterium Z1-6]
MNKVTIEITKEGWQTTVEIDGAKVIEKHVKTDWGASQETENFESSEFIDDELLNTLESADSSAYDIMKELNMCSD